MKGPSLTLDGNILSSLENQQEESLRTKVAVGGRYLQTPDSTVSIPPRRRTHLFFRGTLLIRLDIITPMTLIFHHHSYPGSFEATLLFPGAGSRTMGELAGTQLSTLLFHFTSLHHCSGKENSRKSGYPSLFIL